MGLDGRRMARRSASAPTTSHAPAAAPPLASPPAHAPSRVERRRVQGRPGRPAPLRQFGEARMKKRPARRRPDARPRGGSPRSSCSRSRTSRGNVLPHQGLPRPSATSTTALRRVTITARVRSTTDGRRRPARIAAPRHNIWRRVGRLNAAAPLASRASLFVMGTCCRPCSSGVARRQASSPNWSLTRRLRIQ